MPEGPSVQAPALQGDAVHVWTLQLGRGGREGARRAMRQVLGAYLRIEPDRLPIRTAPQGKPYLDGAPLHFNLSHSRELALLAVSAGAPVGVDLEHPREFHSSERLARRICSDREYASLDNLVAGVHPRLLRLWVRKEAVVKGTGEGLGRPLAQVDVLDDALPNGWLCLDLPSPGAGFQAALAIKARTASLETLRFRLPPSA